MLPNRIKERHPHHLQRPERFRARDLKKLSRRPIVMLQDHREERMLLQLRPQLWRKAVEIAGLQRVDDLVDQCRRLPRSTRQITQGFEPARPRRC